MIGGHLRACLKCDCTVARRPVLRLPVTLDVRALGACAEPLGEPRAVFADGCSATVEQALTLRVPVEIGVRAEVGAPVATCVANQPEGCVCFGKLR